MNLPNSCPITIIGVISLIPALRILRRTGMSAWWALFIILPMIGAIILLWIVAFRQWPGDRSRRPNLRAREAADDRP